MKIYFVLIAVVVQLLFSCGKKDIETFNEHKATSSTAGKPNCTGNYWELDNPFFRGHCENTFNDIPPLMYNNKVYVFNPGNLGQVEVKIYDGTNWASVLSSVPDAYPLCQAYFGFTIGNKGYLVSPTSTFEYAFETNSWTLMAGFPGAYRTDAATFSIGSKGYIVGGSSATSNSINYYDTWEFDPALNTWTLKASLPRGAARTATGFSIGNKGYIVNGFYKNGNTTIYLDDLFEYDPVSDEWNYKTFFPGEKRRHTCVFVIGSTAYAGCGRGEQSYPYSNLKDFYKYTPSSNSWQQVADISPFDVKDFSKYGFVINNRGYVVFDSHTSDPEYYMLKYTPKTCIAVF
jgi:hypothetical protein